MKDAESFQRAFHGIDYTFNWFYVDDKDIAYFNSARLPRRANGVDPDLPTLGHRSVRLAGLSCPSRRTPRDQPAPGYMANWNNKQAPGFDTSDDEWGYGPVYRSQNLSRRIAAGIAGPKKMTRAQLVGAMAEAAHVDTRAVEFLPIAARRDRRRPGVGGGARAAAGWIADGALREDNDRTAGYAHQPAIALFDAWWDERARPATCCAGRSVTWSTSCRRGLDDHPRQGLGSSWNGVAWYGYISKDLRQLLGRPVQGRWHRSYCGGGVARDLPDRAARLAADRDRDRVLAAQGEASVAGPTTSAQDNIRRVRRWAWSAYGRSTGRTARRSSRSSTSAHTARVRPPRTATR